MIAAFALAPLLAVAPPAGTRVIEVVASEHADEDGHYRASLYGIEPSEVAKLGSPAGTSPSHALERNGKGFRLRFSKRHIGAKKPLAFGNGTIRFRPVQVDCRFSIRTMTKIAKGEEAFVIIRVDANHRGCLAQKMDVVRDSDKGAPVSVTEFEFADVLTGKVWDDAGATRHAMFRVRPNGGSGADASVYRLLLRTFDVTETRPLREHAFDVRLDAGIKVIRTRARFRGILTDTKSAAVGAANFVTTDADMETWKMRIEGTGVRMLPDPCESGGECGYRLDHGATGPLDVVATRLDKSPTSVWRGPPPPPVGLESYEFPSAGRITQKGAITAKKVSRPIRIGARASLVCTQRRVEVGDKFDPALGAAHALAYTKARALRRREYASCRVELFFGDLFDEERDLLEVCEELYSEGSSEAKTHQRLKCPTLPVVLAKLLAAVKGTLRTPEIKRRDRTAKARLEAYCRDFPYRCYKHVIYQVGEQQLVLSINILNEGDAAEQVKKTTVPLPVLDDATPLGKKSNLVRFERGRVVIDVGSALYGAIVTHTDRIKYAHVGIELKHLPKDADGSRFKDAEVHSAWAQNADAPYTIGTRVMPRILVWRWAAWRSLHTERARHLADRQRDVGGRLFVSFIGNFSALRYPHSGRGIAASSSARGYELAEFDYGVGITFENWDLSNNEPWLRINPQAQFLVFLPKDFSSRRDAISDMSLGTGIGLRLPLSTPKGSAFSAGTSLGIWYETGPSGAPDTWFHSILVGGSLLVGRILEGS